MKKIKYLVLILLLMLINPLKTYADEFSVSFAHLSDEKNNNQSQEPGDGKISGSASLGNDPNNKNITYNCSYKYAISAETFLKFNIYDINNNSLIDKSLTLNNAVQAGTSVGIYINESKKIGYNIDENDIKISLTQIIPEKTEYIGYKCEYSCETVTGWNSCPYIHPSNITCTLNNSEKQYKKTPSSTKTTSLTKSHAKYADCKSKAISAAVAAANNLKGSSYKTKLTNSNDISNSDKDEINNIVTMYTGGKSAFNKNNLSDSITINYSYKMAKVCLNVKTAKITYRTKTEECTNDEIIISDDTVSGKTHWHYFIPLNSKSNTQIEIEFSKASNDKLSKKTCKSIIDKYKTNKEYLDIIVPLSDNKYSGNTSNDKLITDNAGGCKQVSIIKIPVKQAFYYEEELTKDDGTKQLTLQGNKFYFRRIDIQKPFNYKITDPNSLWYDWYNANYDSENEYSMNKVKPNISASFNKVLYYTQNNNIRDIRKYNSIMKYYDWTEMKKNGESCLISDQNGGTNCDSNTAQGLSIAKRNFNSGDDGTPYKLGHGPESIICTEGDKEVAYIGAKECKNAG